MAFNRQCLGIIGYGANLKTDILQDGTITGAPQVYTYISLTDTVAQIAAADYFVEIAPTVSVGDLFHAIGSDTGITLTVAAVTIGPPASVITEQAVSTGDVDGPASSTDNAIVRWNGVSGRLVQNSISTLDDSGNLTTNNVLITNTGGFPLPTGTTGQRSGSAGTVRYNSTTGFAELTNDGSTWSPISTSTSGVLSVSGTSNRITSTGGLTPQIDISASYVGQTSITTLGTVATGTWSATNIAMNKGGTNASLTASNGGIVWSNATQLQVLSGTATARQMLQSGSTATPAWSSATWPASTTINQILYSSANNTVAGLPTLNAAVLTTSNTGEPTFAVLNDGQLVIGSSSGAPIAATLTAGAGISITNGPNSITVASTDSGMATLVVTGTSQTMAANTQYIANNDGSQVVFTLPATSVVGDVIRVLGKGAAGWSIAQSGSQSIVIDNSSTTAGVSGSLTSTNRYDTIELICITANTEFTCHGPVGYFTIV